MVTHWRILLTVVGFLAGFPQHCQTRADDPPDSPAARLVKLKARYEGDVKAATIPVKDPKTGAFTGYSVAAIPAENYLPQLTELGKSDDEDKAFAALNMAVLSVWGGDPKTNDAFDQLLKRFGGSPKMADFARQHRSHFYLGQDKRLTRLVAEAKDPTAVALSLVQLASFSDPDLCRILGETADNENARREKGLAYYRRVVSEFPNVEKGVPAAMARQSITRLQKLRVGLEAPPIDANDVNGKPMKLTDYRGKVVVIDFWASWCVPCRRNLPILKDVATKYADKGVAFVGVMCEKDATEAAQALDKEKLPWRNWLDMQDEKGGSSIVKAWGVLALPSVYVLDRDGKIRFIRVQERDELERALDTLLAEKVAPPTKK